MPSKNRRAAPRDDSGSSAPFEFTDLLGYRLMRLSAAAGQLADREAREVADLSLPEYRVLAVLLAKGPLGVAALEQTMLIDKAWISRTLGRLVARKLALATPDENDGRRTRFSLTPRGRRAGERLIERARLRQQRILHGLSERERGTLLELLARVQRNVDEMRSGA